MLTLLLILQILWVALVIAQLAMDRKSHNTVMGIFETQGEFISLVNKRVDRLVEDKFNKKEEK